MFTIKQVTTDGVTNFWEGLNPRVVQRGNGPKAYDDRILYFDMPQPGGDVLQGSVDTGSVYIMNSAGKTIDKFHFQPTDEAERTVTLTRGPTNGGLDRLPPDDILEIVSVMQGAIVYEPAKDYTFIGGAISWSPTGAEPAPDSNYTVIYRFDVLSSNEKYARAQALGQARRDEANGKVANHAA